MNKFQIKELKEKELYESIELEKQKKHICHDYCANSALCDDLIADKPGREYRGCLEFEPKTVLINSLKELRKLDKEFIDYGREIYAIIKPKSFIMRLYTFFIKNTIGYNYKDEYKSSWQSEMCHGSVSLD
jgi:hypothetical protein